MPPAGQPVPVLRDRAERHVFERVPELPAIERRVLALLDLADAGRAAAAADTGLDDTALRFAAKRARKALRRTGAPLAAGARCERAELMLSDRLDAPLRHTDRRWLDIHLARCPRCAEHETLLAAAREDLRATFLAEPPALPPAPEPDALPPAKDRLRLVPEPVGGETRPTDVFDGPPPAEPPRPERTPAPPAPVPPLPDTAARTETAKRALRALALLLVLAGIAAAAVAGIEAARDDGPQRAPWTAPSAPDVKPAPLRDQ